VPKTACQSVRTGTPGASIRTQRRLPRTSVGGPARERGRRRTGGDACARALRAPPTAPRCPDSRLGPQGVGPRRSPAHRPPPLTPGESPSLLPPISYERRLRASVTGVNVRRAHYAGNDARETRGLVCEISRARDGTIEHATRLVPRNRHADRSDTPRFTMFRTAVRRNSGRPRQPRRPSGTLLGGPRGSSVKVYARLAERYTATWGQAICGEHG